MSSLRRRSIPSGFLNEGELSLVGSRVINEGSPKFPGRFVGDATCLPNLIQAKGSFWHWDTLHCKVDLPPQQHVVSKQLAASNTRVPRHLLPSSSLLILPSSNRKEAEKKLHHVNERSSNPCLVGYSPHCNKGWRSVDAASCVRRRCSWLATPPSRLVASGCAAGPVA